MIKRFFIAFLLINYCAIFAYSQVIDSFGVYINKQDYLNKKITIIRKLQPSENYNVGILNYKGINIDSIELDVKVNCIKENYWGFRYLDGHDYMLLDGFYAKIVIVGRINLLISPKANFKEGPDGKYVFKGEGKINYYFVKDLDRKTESSFEKLIVDEKLLVKEYQKDKDNYGEFINKQIVYLKKYNSIVPKKKVENKK